MKINAVIIDDERKAIESLRHNLNNLFPSINVIGESKEPEEGLELIISLNPELVFLDIAMPRMSGFDLLAKVENPKFEIIFVTAFDEYAIEAIQHCAIGYLVKPFDNKDLKLAVNQAKKNIQEKNSLINNKQLLEKINNNSNQTAKITIPTQDGLEFIGINQIINCEGVDGYTKLNTVNDGPILSSNSIGHFHKLLKNQQFYLSHKSHLINITHIKKYLNEGYVVMSNKNKIPVSRSKRNKFLEQIKEQLQKS